MSLGIPGKQEDKCLLKMGVQIEIEENWSYYSLLIVETWDQ